MTEQELLDRFHTASRRSALVSLLAALLVLGVLVYSAVKLYNLRETIEQEQRNLAAMRQEKEALTRQIEAKKTELAVVQPLVLRGLGQRVEATDGGTVKTDAGVKAYQAIQELAAKGSERRREITLQYYPRDIEKDLNQTIVLPSLEKLGFQLRQMPASKIAGATNSIWCGAGVPVDDVKLVALTLLAAGVKMRAIREFRNPDGLKRNVVEVGTDKSQAYAAEWTIEKILQATSFERETN